MSLSDFANLIVAATSIFAIVFAVISFRHQNKQARVFLGIQVLREWECRFFYSDDMRRRRYIVCKHFKDSPDAEVPPEAWELLDVFDSVGIYVNNGIIDRSLAWTVFYYWLNGYRFLLKDRIFYLRDWADGVHYLNDLEEMYKCLTDFGVKNRRLPDERKRCSAEKMFDFIEDELNATQDSAWS